MSCCIRGGDCVVSVMLHKRELILDLSIVMSIKLCSSWSTTEYVYCVLPTF